MLLARARLDWLLPLLRASAAAVWVGSGVVSLGLYPVADSLALLARVGLATPFFSTVGTGLGSAFYLFFTNRSGEVRAIAIVSRRVVIADWLFTTPTAIVQPLTGFWLLHLSGVPWNAGWIVWSLALYVLAGACWAV